MKLGGKAILVDTTEVLAIRYLKARDRIPQIQRMW